MIRSYLFALLERQTNAFFPPLEGEEKIEMSDIDCALEAFVRCNRGIKMKYYECELSIDDFYYADKYAVLLYYLAHLLYRAGKPQVATRVYYLNKILHGLDVFYALELPEVLLFSHPVGSVLGRAKYGNYFCMYQNCTVGGDLRHGELKYPVLGRGVVMYAGSKIIGDCQVGDNVIFGANSMVVNTQVPSDSIVVGVYPHHRILPNRHSVLKDCFGINEA